MGSFINGIGVNLAWLLLLLSCVMIASEMNATGDECQVIIKNITIDVPGCEVIHNYSVRACSGYCRSITEVTKAENLAEHPNQIFTTHAECCNAAELQVITPKIFCDDLDDYNIFYEAQSCNCSSCLFGRF